MPSYPVSQLGLALWPRANARPKGNFEQSVARSSLRRVETKEFLFTEGDPVTHVFRVETGAIALYKILADGRRQIMDFAYPSDFIGLGARGEHLMNAQAVKPTRLRCLPIGTFRQCASRDPIIGSKLYEALVGELAASRDHTLTICRRSAIERVVGFLLVCSRRNEQKGKDASRIDLPMTRADIGDFLGLTTETVSRTFTKLRTRGLIEFPCQSQVKLVDIDELETLTEGEKKVLDGRRKTRAIRQDLCRNSSQGSVIGI